MHMKNVYIVNSNSKFLCYLHLFLSHNFMQRNTVQTYDKTKTKKQKCKNGSYIVYLLDCEFMMYM